MNPILAALGLLIVYATHTIQIEIQMKGEAGRPLLVFLYVVVKALPMFLGFYIFLLGLEM